MILIRLTLVLAASAVLALAQDTSHGPQPLPTLRDRASQAPETAAALPATEPVITVHGLCSKPAADPKACTTVVTKDQFDRLVKSLGQSVPANAYRDVAQRYVQLMAFAEAAQKAGIENDPKFQDQLQVARLQLLAGFYNQELQEKNRSATPEEIQAYYSQNTAKYEEIKLSRIFVPAKNPSAANQVEWEKKAAQLANDIHDRAAKGEDFDKLQKEAFTTLGMTSTAPPTSLGTRRRGMLLPPEEQELFALKPGSVSQVEHEPSGHAIYKIESKETVPLEQAKDDVSKAIFRQKMDQQVKAVTDSVHADLNDQYFGPAPAPPPTLQRPAAQK